MSKNAELALLGGSPAIGRPLTPYRTIGREEIDAVAKVMESGAISGFYGSWGPAFNGGPQVVRFEEMFGAAFGSAHAVSVNSNTTGLFAALGAAGVSPGDEVIVPPYTMSATVVTPLFYGAVPVFVDVDPETYCIDFEKTVQAIGPRTRAIVAVNLLGHPAPLGALRELADRRGLCLIEDNAQAPFATENGKCAGTIGHIGVFSLNYHKHFHTGEGGVCLTDDANLAFRMKAIRNHAENIVDPAGVADATNMIGLNLRMTELCAAIGIEQLKKARALVDRRQAIADALSAALGGSDYLRPPVVREGCRHVYYVWGAIFDAAKAGVSRETFVKALAAEGVPVAQGYVKPLYALPAFQRRVAIGRDGWPFNLTNRVYPSNLCPVAERLYRDQLVEIDVCAHEYDDRDIRDIAEAFGKVAANLPILTDAERAGRV